jgi:hypothetical protein
MFVVLSDGPAIFVVVLWQFIEFLPQRAQGRFLRSELIGGCQFGWRVYRKLHLGFVG